MKDLSDDDLPISLYRKGRGKSSTAWRAPKIERTSHLPFAALYNSPKPKYDVELTHMRYAFTLAECMHVTLTMVTEASSIALSLNTQDGTGGTHDPYVSNGSPGNPDTRSCSTMLNPGTHYADVSLFAVFPGPAHFQLRLTGTPIPGFDAEPNDSLAQAIPIALSQPVYGFFANHIDRDVYKLTPPTIAASESYSIDLWAVLDRLPCLAEHDRRRHAAAQRHLRSRRQCRDLYWKTSDHATADVDNGLVTAKSPGDCTITAYVESGMEASVSVRVEYPTATALGFPAKLRLTKGFQYAPIAPSIPDGTKLPELIWSSSKPGVLTVAQDGSLSAKKKGTATLTVAAKGGSPSASCKVTVGANELKRSKPPSDGPGLFSCAKRLYYSGNHLYIEVHLYNRTGRRITKSGELWLYLYDFAYSADRPLYKKTISWSFGTLYNKQYKVYKTRLPRSHFGGFDLGAGQIEAVLVGNFKARRVPRKTGVSP